MQVASSGVKPTHLEVPLKSIFKDNTVSVKSTRNIPDTLVIARFSNHAGVGSLRFFQGFGLIDDFDVDLGTARLLSSRRFASLLICEKPADPTKEYFDPQFASYQIEFWNEDDKIRFHSAFEIWRKNYVNQEVHIPPGPNSACKCKFHVKTDPAYAKTFFRYYGRLHHQQTMLEDHVMTGTYHAAIIENRDEFKDRIVVDIGAGSGILSLFAVQAGAKHVYAVEASGMADYARELIAGNPTFSERITVIKGKAEEIFLPHKADILISEPLGTLLVNERMLETYIIARDRFLAPEGKMFPSIGRIHMALFSDEGLYAEIAHKALFWQQSNYYGVDLRPLYESAYQENFTQPVVDAFDPRILVSRVQCHEINFKEIKEEDLHEIDIPLEFIAATTGRVHGLACWFDALFQGSAAPRWLRTAPHDPTTHWFQIRCVLSQPLYVNLGQEITGRLHMLAHYAQSYTINLTLSAKIRGPGAEEGTIVQTSSCRLDLKDPYYRMSRPRPNTAAQYRQPH